MMPNPAGQSMLREKPRNIAAFHVCAGLPLAFISRHAAQSDTSSTSKKREVSCHD